MSVLLLIGLNILLMIVCFAVGIYQFLQIEDKRKRRDSLRLRSGVRISEFEIDETEIRQLVRNEQYEQAVKHLMHHAEVDQFTALSAVEQIKQEEYVPYYRNPIAPPDHP